MQVIDERELMRYPILRLQEFGYQPVLLKHGEKRAAFKEWQKRPMDRRELDYWTRRYAYNVGILLKGLVVIDRDAASKDAYNLVRKHRVHRSTMEVQTANGSHFYFRLPEGVEEVRTRIKFLGLPLDVLTRCALHPPSWRRDVEWRYDYRKGTQLVRPEQLPVLPDSFLDLLKQEEVKESPAPVAIIPPSADERMIRYVERIDPSVQGENGSRSCFVACLKILTLTDGDMDKAWALALYYNSIRCSPPWDVEKRTGPDSLWRKLEEARKVWRK